MITQTVLDLLDRLEAVLVRSTSVPLTDKKVVTEHEVLGLLQMIRAQLPKDLRDAQRLRQEAEQLHRSAQDDARRIVLDAQGTAQRFVEHSAVLKAAEQRGHDLIVRAEQEAASVRDGADAYAGTVLADLEEQVLRILEAIRRGRQLLKHSGG